MSFYLGQLEEEIYQRLEPLRQALIDADIPLACLPKNAGNYKREVDGLISILIPNVSNVEVFNKVSNTQLVEHTILINLSLPKRYQETDVEKDVLEFCVQQVTGLLLGFKPTIKNVRREFNFNQYSLFRPEGKMWEAQLEFNVQIDIASLPQKSSIIKEQLEKITLFASDKYFTEVIELKEYLDN